MVHQAYATKILFKNIHLTATLILDTFILKNYERTLKPFSIFSEGTKELGTYLNKYINLKVSYIGKYIDNYDYIIFFRV